MNKRKIISVFLAVGLFVSSFSVTSAIEVNSLDINTKADALNMIGMLSGDDKGNYNLSSTLKRSEAATFIVKLMGQNDYLNKNKANYINTGFSDVSSKSWYAAYVGYCKENSILSGMGDNKFLPNETTTEKAFLSMTMKVLGYTSEDFDWSNVYQKAFEIGLVTEDLYQNKTDDNTNFTRAEVVEIMTRALRMKTKDTGKVLFKTLVKSGAIALQKATDAGFICDELPSKIAQITTLGDQWVLVRFNEPVKALTASNILIYEKSSKAKLNFSIAAQSDTEYKLKTDLQKSGANYVIEVSSVVDMEDNEVSKVESTFTAYENKGLESDLFKISKIEQRANNEVSVYFTHPININAEQPEFYSVLENGSPYITGDKNNLSVKVMEGQGNIVIINTKNNVFKTDSEYTVKISGSLKSSYGINLGTQEQQGDQMIFIAKDIKVDQFSLVKVAALNNKSIQLDFNKQLNKSIAEKVFNYYITDSKTNTQVQISSAAVIDNSYGKECGVIINTTNPLPFDNNASYNLMVIDISDATGQYKITEQKYTFNSTPIVTAGLLITSVTYVDPNTITLTFSKNVSPASAEDISNYTLTCSNDLTYSAQPVKAVYSSETPQAVKLYFPYMKPMKTLQVYTIKLSAGYQDYTGSSMSVPMIYSFAAQNTAKSKLEISKASLIASDTIKVFFNRDIALDSPNILTQNYYLQGVYDQDTKMVPVSINYIDNTSIVFKFDKIDDISKYYIKYKELKDITGETYNGDQSSAIITKVE